MIIVLTDQFLFFQKLAGDGRKHKDCTIQGGFRQVVIFGSEGIPKLARFARDDYLRGGLELEGDVLRGDMNHIHDWQC